MGLDFGVPKRYSALMNDLRRELDSELKLGLKEVEAGGLVLALVYSLLD